MLPRSLSAVAAGLLLTFLPAVPATAAPGERTADTVTLVTGDRVTVTGARVRIDPAPGRERAMFASRSPPPRPRTARRVDAVWDFRSSRAQGNAALPLTGVRFVPRLDAAGTAPAGRLFAIPLQVQQYDGGGAGRVRRITAQVSYDDGRTWRPAPVIADNVVLRHPAAPGHVSLRARATDSKGNTVIVTVLRAYALRAS